MSEGLQILSIKNQLKGFKKKYYLSRLIKGLLFGTALLLAIFLLISYTEYTFRLSSPGRLLLLISFIVFTCIIVGQYIIYPTYKLFTSKKQISDQEAAKIIGKYFREIDDKLLNIIQLYSNQGDLSLVNASLQQKALFLEKYDFKSTISVNKESRKILPYFIGSFIIFLFVLFSSPNLMKDGSYRVLKYQESFIPPAPFNFKLTDTMLKGYIGEDFNIKVKVEGESIPDLVYISKNDSKFEMEKIDKQTYQFKLNQVQRSTNFSFEGGGYKSENYELTVSERPLIKNQLIEARYPKYLNISDDKFFNANNLKVPSGTLLKWTLNTQSASKVNMTILHRDTTFQTVVAGVNNLFRTEYKANKTYDYAFNIINNEGDIENTARHTVSVIPDIYPSIDIKPTVDSTYYNSIIIEGNITDDYGFSRLKLYYSTDQSTNNNQTFSSLEIPIKKDNRSQKYFFNWSIDSLLSKEKDQLIYYTQVWDNDGINGLKSSKSAIIKTNYPTKESINNSIKTLAQNTDNQISKTLTNTNDLEKKLEKLNEILKTKQQINFDDKELIKDILEQSEEIDKKLKEIQDKLIENKEKREKFSNPDKNLKEKNDALIDRIKEMQSDQRKELLDKINELLSKTEKSDDLRESATELSKNEKNRLKELERLMQLYKRLEIEYDISRIKNQLEKIAAEQNNLSEDSMKSLENTLSEQQKLNQDFEKIKESLKDTKQKNQKLEQPAAIKNTKDIENDIDQKQQESSQELKQKQSSKAKDLQKDAGKKMQEMAQVMEKMQSGMQGEQIQENIDDLRDVVDNLLKLSFRQEEIMGSLNNIDVSDPRFLKLSERQLNLKDDIKIVDDSLTAIGKRVFQIEGIITSEMNGLKESIDKSIEALKIREDNKAVGYQQQAMEHTNNLALLLDDIIQQMQMQMQSSGSQSSNDQEASPSEMQKALNQKTKELSEGQKSGRQFSEELAKLAAEQGRLRRLTEEMKKNTERGEAGGSSGLDGVMEEMEKIEEELVNKRLNNKLIERQQKIVTKLLEAEKAKNQKEEDNERKAETASTNYSKKKAKAIEEYIANRKKEIEKLNKTPPSLSPYYKEAVIKYYNRIKTED